MATAIYIPARRVVLTALARFFGSRYFVIIITLGLGATLFLWARSELAGMFERAETGEIRFGVTDAAPGCAPPSLYLLPDREKAGPYLAVFDMLGGGIADPSILNIGRPSVAVTNIESTEGGGARSTISDCGAMRISIGDADHPPLMPTPEEVAGATNVGWSDAVTREGADGDVLRFDLAAGASEAAGRTAFRLDGIADAWQFGYRRLNLWNTGRLPVNVYLLDQPGYAFLSDNFEPIKVPVRNRSIAALRLTPPGLEGGNAFQVYSRLIDYDARLQGRLLTVSTIFGIGISLMVEGAILALLKLARWLAPAGARAEGDGREE